MTYMVLFLSMTYTVLFLNAYTYDDLHGAVFEYDLHGAVYTYDDLHGAVFVHATWVLGVLSIRRRICEGVDGKGRWEIARADRIEQG